MRNLKYEENISQKNIIKAQGHMVQFSLHQTLPNQIIFQCAEYSQEMYPK